MIVTMIDFIKDISLLKAGLRLYLTNFTVKSATHSNCVCAASCLNAAVDSAMFYESFDVIISHIHAAQRYIPCTPFPNYVVLIDTSVKIIRALEADPRHPNGNFNDPDPTLSVLNPPAKPMLTPMRITVTHRSIDNPQLGFYDIADIFTHIARYNMRAKLISMPDGKGNTALGLHITKKGGAELDVQAASITGIVQEINTTHSGWFNNND